MRMIRLRSLLSTYIYALHLKPLHLLKSHKSEMNKKSILITFYDYILLLFALPLIFLHYFIASVLSNTIIRLFGWVLLRQSQRLREIRIFALSG